MNGARTELDNVANDAHDQETHADSLGDLEELFPISCNTSHVSNQTERYSPSRKGHIRFWHLCMNCRPSLTNSLGTSRISWIWSDMVIMLNER
jgi:hypothetical protein